MDPFKFERNVKLYLKNSACKNDDKNYGYLVFQFFCTLILFSIAILNFI